MKKTVSFLTALLLAVSPVAQRAYAQEATVQVQQNVEESKASKVWRTVKECAGKTVNAVAENKGIIIGSALALAALGEGIFATVNGVTFSDTIHTIWDAKDITVAQKAKLIAKVLLLRKTITNDELATLRNQNIIDASNAIINEKLLEIKSINNNLEGIKKEQDDLNTQKATQEARKYKAMCSMKGACDVYKKTHEAMNSTLVNDTTCTLGAEYRDLDCTAYDRERCDCGKQAEKTTGDCTSVCPQWDESNCKCGENDENKNEKCVPICENKLQNDCKCGTNEQLSSEKCQNVCPELTEDICKCNTENQLTLDGCKEICKDR